MIISIESSIPTFKTINFHEGLNVLLADKLNDVTSKRTRNSAGKTSLIEIIHFIFGSDCDPDSIFRTPQLIDHSFTATLMLDGMRFRVQRTASTPSKIFILEGGLEREDLSLKTDKETEKLFISNINWRIFLGHVFFDMPFELEGSIFNESYTPSFRSMFSYFARRVNSGGYISPERHAEKQQRYDWQVNLSYLFGLDWKIPFEFNKVRSKERTLDELKKAAKGGALGNLVGTVAEIRPKLAVAETQAAKLRNDLESFSVLDTYRDLSKHAAQYKTELQGLSQISVSLQETLNHLRQALATESQPSDMDLDLMYKTAGIELPGIVLKRFEAVESFYSSVILNRKSHLHNEISDTEKKLANIESKMKLLDTKRKDILQTLQGKGALDDFIKLQRDLAELDASVASLRERYQAAEILEGQSTQLDLDRTNLKLRLQEDHQQRDDALSEPILIIASVIQDLYEDRSGGFVVEATSNGPEFRINIEGDRGGGISQMEIFCMDVALLKVVTNRYGGTKFLIHDSHLFDGVDERQVAIALQIMREITQQGNLQYIVTLNSDIFDRLPLPGNWNLDDFVLPVRLSDQTQTGGLFGFRF